MNTSTGPARKVATTPSAKVPVIWRRITVVVDPATVSQPALEKAAHIARHTGASLELYVCEVQQEIPESWAGADRAREYRDILRTRARGELQSLAQPLRASGLAVTTEYEWHAPLEQGIGHHVIRTRPDLVVKDVHREGPAREGAFSRADWNLIGQVPAPLLLVRPGHWPAAPRIVAAPAPADASDPPAPLHEWIVAAGQALADVLQGSLDLLHAGQPAPDILVMDAGAQPRLPERVACDLLVVKPPGFASPLLATH